MATVMVIMAYLQEKNRLDLNMEIINYQTLDKETKMESIESMPFIFDMR